MVECSLESPKGTQIISPAREHWGKIAATESRRDDTGMPQTYAANFVHCIFSTKDRHDIIPEMLQEKLYAYLFGLAKNLRITLIAVGGTANHIHLLLASRRACHLRKLCRSLRPTPHAG
jgi:Transposase IS200 like